MNDCRSGKEKSDTPPAGSVTAIESLTGLLLQSATGAKWTRPTPAVKDRIAVPSRDVQIIIPQPQDVNEHIVSGRVRPIAALTEKRLTVLPQVPTIKEQGINVPIIANARGILAPPGVSKEVILFWEDFFARLTQTASWKKYVADNQVEDVFIKGGESAIPRRAKKLMRSAARGVSWRVEKRIGFYDGAISAV
jgi:putative tricarboxylic transport membrane protein